MDKLSELLQEAKPMYRAQQRNIAIAKMMLCLCLPVFVCTSIISLCNMGDDIYVSLNNDSYVEQLLNDDFGLIEVK